MRKESARSEQYMESFYPTESKAMQQARLDAADLGLGGISISQHEAKIIDFILGQIKPKKIVEIGTLTGLSALYFLKQATQYQGKLWTLEKSAEHADRATKNLAPYIAEGTCEVILGDAREKLKSTELTSLSAHGPFDCIFIDGNKAAYLDYWNWAKEHVTENGLVIIDNVFLSGAVWGEATTQKFSEKQIKTVQDMTKNIFSDPDFNSVFIPTSEGLIFAQKIKL